MTDEMFIAAARAVADQLTPAELDAGLLHPPQSDILKTEIKTALPAAEIVFSRGLAGVARPKDLRAFIQSKLYKLEYRHLH